MQTNSNSPASAASAGELTRSVHGQTDRLIRLPEVLRITGRSRTTTLDDVKARAFPQPIKIGRATMWVEAEIQGWIAARISAARGAR